MKALVYLRWMKLKNQLKSLIRKPGRLIYVLFLLACLGITLWSGHASNMGRPLHSVSELAAIGGALYTLMTVLTVNTGFSRGGSLFTMSDVNLLFPTPIRPQTLLFYGLLQQMATSLLVGFFLLFQYSNLRNLYGISFWQMLALLGCYALSLFVSQVAAMLLYALTSHREGRARACRVGLSLLAGAFAAYVVVTALPGGAEGLVPRVAAAVTGPVFLCAPIAGWLTLASLGILTGSAGQILLGLGLCAGFVAILIVVLFRADPDYYEDVLKSAELTQSAITAKKEGGAMAEASPIRVKVGKTGLHGGWGSSAFYYKHRLENRRSRKFLLSGNVFVFAATTILFALFLRGAGLVPTFAMSTYLQLFSTMIGRLNQELTRPYLYLVPEPPFRKLIWAMAEQGPSALAEAVVIFIPVGWILQLSVPVTLCCILARLSISLLYTAANVAVERLWGGVVSKVLSMLLYLAITLALAIPGGIAAGVLAFALDAGTVWVLLGLTVCNVPMSLLALLLCRNMLQYAELNNQ